MAEPRTFKHRVYARLARLIWRGLDVPLALYQGLLPRATEAPTHSCVLLHSFDGYKRFWPAALHFSRLTLVPRQSG